MLLLTPYVQGKSGNRSLCSELLQNIFPQCTSELPNPLLCEFFQCDVLHALDISLFLAIEPFGVSGTNFLVVIVSQPVFVTDRSRVAEFFIKELLKVDLVRTLQDSLPEFQDFFYVPMDLISSCTAIVNDTFLKKRATHGKCLSSELRCNDAAFPIEIHIRKVDSGNTFILISGKNTLIKYRDKAFKLRPELTDLFRQVLKDINTLGSTNVKMIILRSFVPRSL